MSEPLTANPPACVAAKMHAMVVPRQVAGVMRTWE